jgi:ribosomal subunit interface protein
MDIPLHITIRDIPHRADIEERIRERARKLERFYTHIIKCRVAVQAPHQHHRTGQRYSVRIDLTVPRNEIVVTREENEDLLLAIREAFDAARRRLEDYARRQRGDTKSRAGLPAARVSQISPEQDHGFLRTPDGREVYFHRHAVLDGKFDSLAIGTEVQFFEEQGTEGPQASTVRVVRQRVGAQRA